VNSGDNYLLMLRKVLYLTLSGLYFVNNYYVGALPRPDICNPFGVKLLKIVPKGDNPDINRGSQGQRPWFRVTNKNDLP